MPMRSARSESGFRLRVVGKSSVDDLIEKVDVSSNSVMGATLLVISRIIAAAVGGFFAWRGIRNLIWLFNGQFDWQPAVGAALLITICLFCFLFAWRGKSELGRILPALIIGVGIGLLGGVAAFFYVGSLHPQANFPLRAMIAFLDTTFLGFVIGSLGGYAWQLATGRALVKL